MVARRTADVLGKGLSFPLGVDAAGRLRFSEGEENIRQSLRILLMTEPGERILLERYGCGLKKFLFEPNTAATRQLIVESITRAIETWEPRVALQEVVAEPDADDPVVVQVTILFRLVATRQPGRLALALTLES